MDVILIKAFVIILLNSVGVKNHIAIWHSNVMQVVKTTRHLVKIKHIYVRRSHCQRMSDNERCGA